MNDLCSERILLSSLINHGAEALHHIEEYIDETDFALNENRIIYSVYKNLILKEDIKKPGFAEVVSIIQKQCPDLDDKIDFLNYISILAEDNVEVDNIKPFCVNVKKCGLSRKLSQKLLEASKSLENLSGNESVLDIIHKAENPITSFINSVLGSVDTKNIYDDLDEYIKYLLEEKPEQLGVPTGFPRFDYAIGGGLRKPGVHLIGGRAKCISIDSSFLLTSKGILSPKELHNDIPINEYVDYSVINRSGELSNCKIMKSDKKKLKQIITDKGKYLDLSEDHRLLTLTTDGVLEYKTVKELTLTDILVSKINTNVWGQRNDIPIDIAYMAGLIVGDGCISRTNTHIINMDKEIIDFVKDFAKNRNFHLNIYQKKDNKALSLTLTGNYDLRDIIFKYDSYYTNKNKIIPIFIRESNKETVCACVSGMFDTDGCVESRSISYCTKSYLLRNQLQTILNNLGIKLNCREKIINNTTYYEINIYGVDNHKIFAKHIGFRIKRKQDKLNNLLLKQSLKKKDTVPNLNKRLKIVKNDITSLNHNDRDVLNAWIRQSRSVRRDVFNRIVEKNIWPDDFYEIFDENIEYSQIKEIRDIGEQETCDYFVPNNNSFVVNSIISHNSGKSYLGISIANNIVKKGVPVLYLDTELSNAMVKNRLLSCNLDIKINDLERGKFDATKIANKLQDFKKHKLSYHNISGLQHHEWMSIIRRWLLKEVGFNADGTAKECLVVLDYIKTMDLGVLKNLTEWQYLGQVITDLHNFCIKYNVPILSFTQLNREGITNDHQGVIAGSDRLMALCSSFSILRKKTAEDLAADPLKDTQGRDILTSGDRKLVIIDCRFGPGMEQGEYINIRTDLSKGIMVEGYTNLENQSGVTTINNQTLTGTVANDESEQEDTSGEPPPF